MIVTHDPFNKDVNEVMLRDPERVFNCNISIAHATNITKQRGIAVEQVKPKIYTVSVTWLS